MIEDIPVKVFIRARPFNDKERLENARECLQISVEANQVSCNGRAFTFDGVLDPSTSQDSVYEVTSSFLLEQFFKGFNCTVLAYGQTGSGKTYTMGTEESNASLSSDSRGIIPRLVDALFRQISECGLESSFKVYASMLELYDEKVLDLLSGGKEPLQVREQSGSVFVQGLSRFLVRSLTETMAQLEKGGSLRSKGETAMNALSSRSHAIFTISLEKAGTDNEDDGFSAKLHLVDLAGSERLKKTHAEGTRKIEGIRINEGLLALGNVISALSEPGNKHIPYRDSKITRLLQDSLGGNSYTVMIACISPADSNAEETLSTLRYADRAKKIKNKPIVNVDAGQQKIRELKEKVAALERELAETRMGFTPHQAGSDLSVFDLAQMKAILSEKDNLLKAAHEKAAEAICQKTKLWNQLQEEREHLKTIVLQAVESIRASGDTFEKADIIKRIEDVLTQEVIEEEERDSSIPQVTQGDTDDEIMDDTFSMKFVDKQNNLDKELGDVMQQIRDKEEVLLKAVESQRNVDEIINQYKQEMTTLQQRIDALLAEKAKLEADLKRISVNNRLAEERRRKLSEMEKQLAQFRKRMNEMKRLEKQKQQSEEIQKRMQAEIAALKQAKVRMMKQQRDEAEKYRQWKLKHDRELVQFKQKERKRDFEAAREKRVHDQQMLICKQKLEEAKKVNKRLMAQMERTAAVSRDKPDSEKSLEQAKRFFEAELSLIGSSHEAEQMCQSLKDQRNKLGRKKARLLRERERYISPDEPLRKRRSTDEGSTLSPEDREALQKLEEELERIDHQQMLCSDELNKLQQGCGSIDAESRIEARFRDILTLASSRVYLKALFEQAANERRTTVELEIEKKKLQDKIKEMESTQRDLKKEQEEELRRIKENNRKLVVDFERQKSHAEVEFLNLVNMMTTSPRVIDEEAIDKLKILRDEIAQLVQFKNKLEKNESTRPTKPKRLERSRSTSYMERLSPVLTTEEERRTRSSRHTIQRFGNVKNPLQEVEPDSDEGESLMDISYHPQQENARRRRKPKIVTDLSPIPDLTMVAESEAGGDNHGASPRSSRSSMQSHKITSRRVSVSPEKENALGDTFVVEKHAKDSHDSTESRRSIDEERPPLNATLISGLVPHVDPALGPI